MPQEIQDAGRVTVFRLLHMWRPRRVGIVAYASTGNFGDTGVLGYIPFPEIPDLSLMDVAARHKPSAVTDWRSPKPGYSEACWLLCTGASSRWVKKSDTIDFYGASWTLEIDGSVELGNIAYGHTALKAGRFRLDDPELMAQARGLLQPGDVPEMNEADLPAYSA